MFPPKLIKPYVVSFCRSVVRDPNPHFVPVQPRANAEVNECFPTVHRQVQEHGGTALVGWMIWDWPDVMIEAEYHCIWRSPTGEEIDVTPKNPPIKRIAFLPDPHRPYGGFQRDNIRKPLCRDKDLLRLIKLGELIHEEMNRGDLKYQHGEVAVNPIVAEYQKERMSVSESLAERYGDRLHDLAQYAL